MHSLALWEREAGCGWPLVVGICSSGELSRRHSAGYRDTVGHSLVSPTSDMWGQPPALFPTLL